MSTPNGAFLQSKNGAFVQSKNGERGFIPSAGPGGELFVAYQTNYQWDSNPYTGPYPDPQGPLNVTRQVIEIQRFDSETGAFQEIVFTLESVGHPARVTVNPPNQYDGVIDLRGLERIGDNLFLLVEEKIAVHVNNSNLDEYESRLIKLTLNGTVVDTLVFATEYLPFSTQTRPIGVCHGTQQDGDEEPVEDRLYLFSRSRVAGADPSTLVVVNPISLSTETPIAGLGSTYDSNYGTNGLISAYHNDTTLGAGVRYIYDAAFNNNVQAAEGTSGHEEWNTSTNLRYFRITHTTAGTPQVHRVQGEAAIKYSIQTGALISFNLSALLNNGANTNRGVAVRHIGASEADYYYVTSSDQVRGRNVVFGGSATTIFTTAITPSVLYTGGIDQIHLPQEVPQIT